MWTHNFNLEIEQQILPNLFFTAGWLRQDIEEVDNYTMNSLTGATIQVDTNTRLIDGRVNPYFGIPFVSEGVGGGLDTWRLPETDDNYRAMLAYDLDLTKRGGWMKWLGRHRLLGLWSEQDVFRQVERWRMNFIDGDADARLRYVSNLALAGQQQALSTATMRKYYMGSPGGPQARATHSVGFYGNQGWDRPIVSDVQVYNYATGQFQNDRVVEQTLYSPAGSGQGSSQREVKSTNFAVQSYLWDGRLIATLGGRTTTGRVSTTGAITDADGAWSSRCSPTTVLHQRLHRPVNHDLIMRRWDHWKNSPAAPKPSARPSAR